jgi:hypothetical protein
MERLMRLKKMRLEEKAFLLSEGVVEVVAERYKNPLLGGTTDRGWKVAFSEAGLQPGDEVSLRLVGFDGDRSLGEVLSSSRS